MESPPLPAVSIDLIRVFDPGSSLCCHNKSLSRQQIVNNVAFLDDGYYTASTAAFSHVCIHHLICNSCMPKSLVYNEVMSGPTNLLNITSELCII